MKSLRWLTLATLGLAGGYWLTQRTQAKLAPGDLKNKVVLITGASSGIGRALAVAFAQRGAKLVLAARRVEMLEAARNEIVPYAADVLIVPTDVTDESQLQSLVDTTLQRFGRIDVLVNNAGVPSGGQLHTIPLKAIRNTLNVNLDGAIMLTSLCLPSMLAQRSGHIINISSIIGLIAFPYYSVYGVTKHGLRDFSTFLRRELDGTGVKVMSVMPSWTATELVPDLMQQSMQNAGTPMDTAEYVAERVVDGLLQGQNDIYFGDLKMRIGFWLERHFPTLMSLYLKATMTPKDIQLSRGG
jgi:short-subunit dehydrogenase